ncbi:MAG: hypothetical protein ACREI6_04510 [Candidatus Rokuibacteriota bacterium]
MRLRGDRLAHRVGGALLGAGFLLLGLFSAVMSDAPAGSSGRDRAIWLGITLIVIGAIAIIGSLTVEDPDRIWCRHPRRRGRFR